ncbi:MAG: ATP-binding response regulator [Terriglobales bacterium]
MKNLSGPIHRPLEILQFEDSESDSVLVQSHLEGVPSIRARFTTVDRLEAGLKLLEQGRFDVALLDLNLPDSRGLESLDTLRRAEPKLPIVVISGQMDDALALELLGRGAQDCLEKGAALKGRIANAIRFAIRRRQTEERARAILDASIDATVVLDHHGVVRYANPAAEGMFGRQASELKTQPFGLPLTTDRTTEIDIIRSNGESGVAEMRVTEINWEEGDAYLASMRDITERKQMEEALLRSEKMKALGTLAGGIAHDFNNILLAVSGNADLALADLPEDHPARASVLEIAKAGSRAVALTRKILSFSRQQVVNRQAIQLQPVAQEALSMLRATLPAQIEIRWDFPADLPPVSADSSQVHQILVNLATNASHAIGDRPGTLDLQARCIHVNGERSGPSSALVPGDYVRLSVEDNGPGMDKKTMARVFEPFFTTKAQGRGTGLGLAIVYGIMKEHLGEVTVHSEVGKGTVFNLYFPVAEGALPEVQPATETPTQGRGQRILYVDDEEPLVLLVPRILKRLGYEVSGFTDPLEALRALRKDPADFHAVVTDLSMPSMSGTDLALEVLQICPNLPVILTTGYVRPEDQEFARRAGVREVILKPDTIEQLGSVLHRLLCEAEEKPKPATAEALKAQMRVPGETQRHNPLSESPTNKFRATVPSGARSNDQKSPV